MLWMVIGKLVPLQKYVDVKKSFAILVQKNSLKVDRIAENKQFL